MRSEIVSSFFKNGIPIAVSDTEHMDIYLPCDRIIVTERYILGDVKYLAAMYGKSEVTLYDESVSLGDFVLQIYNEHLRKRCEGEGHRRVELKGSSFTFFRKSVFLTGTEMRILRMLLYYRDWVSAERISLYCLRGSKADGASVAVHVCNINRKMKAATGFEMVEKKRYSGYKIME